MTDDQDMMESEDEADEQETALLPRSWFQGSDIEIGKKCKLKVEGVFEDEIEVSYVKSKKKDGKDSDDDDDDDKPKRRRDRDSREGEMMDAAMMQMDGMGAPAPGGY